MRGRICRPPGITMKQVLTAVVALMWATASVAGPNWSYLELGYTFGDNDRGNTGPNDAFNFGESWDDGTKFWNLNGMIEVGSIWHLGAFFEKGEFDLEFDTQGWGAIAGIHPAVTDSTDLLLQVSYTRAEAKANNCDNFQPPYDFYPEDNSISAASFAVADCSGKSKNNYWSLETGLRSMLSPAVEVNATILGNKNRWNNIEVAAKVGGQYLFTKNAGLTAFAKLGESQTEINIGLRYNFGDKNLNQIQLQGTR